MKFKKNLILLLILVVAALLVIFLERPFENKTQKALEEANPMFPALQTEEVKKLEITRPNDEKTVVLEKLDQIWYVTEKKKVNPGERRTAATPSEGNQKQRSEEPALDKPSSLAEASQKSAELYPADEDAVKEVAEKLKGLQEVDLASRNKDKHEIFQVTEDAGIEVIAYGTGDKELARLFVGKEGPDFFSTYVRKADSDVVYLYQDFIKGSFDRQLPNWRDKNILKFASDEAAGIKIAKKDGIIVLKKSDDGAWRIQEPTDSAADPATVTKVLSNLSTLRAGKFADGLTPEDCGLSKPDTEITVTLNDGSAKTVLIGNKNKKEENYYYAKAGDKQYIYEVYKSVVDSMTPSLKDLEQKEPQPEATKKSAADGAPSSSKRAGGPAK